MANFIKLISCLLILVKSYTVAAPVSPVLGTAELASNTMPGCWIQCQIDITSESICKSIENTTCTCENINLENSLNTCLTQICNISVIQLLGLKKNTDARCNKRIESRVALLQGVAIPFFLVTFICIFLRLYTRWDQRIFKADDWIMLAVLIVLIPFVVQSLMGIQLGFGRNIWDVEPEDVVFVIRNFYVGQIFYTILIAFPKLSMLLFYLRLFPSLMFKRLAYALFTFIALAVFIWMPIQIFQCNPISYIWLGWKGDWHGKFSCQNIVREVYVHAYINTAQEILVFLLPMPWLVRLKIDSKKRKAGLLALFSYAILCVSLIYPAHTCVVSIVRLTKLSKFKSTRNPTWDYTEIIFWTFIEISLNVTIANIPAIRTLLGRKFPSLFGSDSVQTGKNMHKQNSFSKAKGLRMLGESRAGVAVVEGSNGSTLATASSGVEEMWIGREERSTDVTVGLGVCEELTEER